MTFPARDRASRHLVGAIAGIVATIIVLTAGLAVRDLQQAALNCGPQETVAPQSPRRRSADRPIARSPRIEISSIGARNRP
jgi:hypothetical protein